MLEITPYSVLVVQQLSLSLRLIGFYHGERYTLWQVCFMLKKPKYLLLTQLCLFIY